MHDVDAPFGPAPRHNDAILHLLQEFFGFSFDIVCLDGLVQIRVHCLGHGCDTAAMGKEDVHARPAKPLYFFWREVRRVVVCLDDSPSPIVPRLRQVALEEVQHVGGAVRSFLGRGDGEPLAVPFVADIFAQAELHPHTVVFEEQLAIRKLACLNPRFVRESREVRRPPFSCVRVAFDQWHVAARYRERD